MPAAACPGSRLGAEQRAHRGARFDEAGRECMMGRWCIVCAGRVIEETFSTFEAAQNWARFLYLPPGTYSIQQITRA
jgi:hypothetical protein